MTRTPVRVSSPRASLTAAPVGIGLTNPATRFRKIFPYVGTGLVLVMAGAGYATIRGMATSRDWLGHTYEVKSELANLEINRGLLHEPADCGASHSEASARVRSAAAAMRQSLSQLKELTQGNGVEQERLRQLEPILVAPIRSARYAGHVRATVLTEEPSWVAQRPSRAPRCRMAPSAASSATSIRKAPLSSLCLCDLCDLCVVFRFQMKAFHA